MAFPTPELMVLLLSAMKGVWCTLLGQADTGFGRWLTWRVDMLTPCVNKWFVPDGFTPYNGLCNMDQFQPALISWY